MPNTKKRKTRQRTQPTHWGHRRVWCRQVGIGYSTYKTLAPESMPRTVKVGLRHEVILESPADWLERMLMAGGAKTKRMREPALIREPKINEVR